MSEDSPDDWERLLAAQPVDVATLDLATYRGLKPPWNDWRYVTERGRHWARRFATLLLDAEEEPR